MFLIITLIVISLSFLDISSVCFNLFTVDNDLEYYETIDYSYLGERVYGVPKKTTDDVFTSIEDDKNPEEYGEYAEGDILFPHSKKGDGKNGMRDTSTRWPNAIVPYRIEGRYSQEQYNTIMKGISDYHKLTCIRFVPHNGQRDYVAIQNRNTGCWSSIGRIGGRQEVNLQSPGCVYRKGTVMHELMHALGFLHEQSRPERDNYVDVHYENVKSGAELNFNKADKSTINDFGVTYDYTSVMHYSEYAFSKNGQKTIEAKDSDVKLGQRDGLSDKDIKKINTMYNCKKSEPNPTTSAVNQGWIDAVWSILGY